MNSRVRESLHVAPWFGAFLFACIVGVAQQPTPVPARRIQGASHAFLVIRAESGAILGYGELL